MIPLGFWPRGIFSFRPDQAKDRHWTHGLSLGIMSGYFYPYPVKPYLGKVFINSDIFIDYTFPIKYIGKVDQEPY